MSFYKLKESEFYLALPLIEESNANVTEYMASRGEYKRRLVNITEDENGKEIIEYAKEVDKTRPFINKPIFKENIVTNIDYSGEKGNYVELYLERSYLNDKNFSEVDRFSIRFGEEINNSREQKGSVQFIREKGENEYKISFSSGEENKESFDFSREDAFNLFELSKTETYDDNFIKQFFLGDKAKKIFKKHNDKVKKIDDFTQTQNIEEVDKISFNINFAKENVTLENNKNLRFKSLEKKQHGKHFLYEEKYDFQTNAYSGINKKQSYFNLASEVKVKNGISTFNSIEIKWKIDFDNNTWRNDNSGNINIHSHGEGKKGGNQNDFTVIFNKYSKDNFASKKQVSGIEELNAFISETLHKQLGNEFIDISINQKISQPESENANLHKEPNSIKEEVQKEEQKQEQKQKQSDTQEKGEYVNRDEYLEYDDINDALSSDVLSGNRLREFASLGNAPSPEDRDLAEKNSTNIPLSDVHDSEDIYPQKMKPNINSYLQSLNKPNRSPFQNTHNKESQQSKDEDDSPLKHADSNQENRQIERQENKQIKIPSENTKPDQSNQYIKGETRKIADFVVTEKDANGNDVQVKREIHWDENNLKHILIDKIEETPDIVNADPVSQQTNALEKVEQNDLKHEKKDHIVDVKKISDGVEEDHNPSHNVPIHQKLEKNNRADHGDGYSLCIFEKYALATTYDSLSECENLVSQQNKTFKTFYRMQDDSQGLEAPEMPDLF